MSHAVHAPLVSQHAEETPGMIGLSSSFHQVKISLARVASSNCTVLITGDTGTGKELAAEFIHRNSPRRSRSFVCINCAALPDTLLESELFGHSRGAFTGADQPFDGLLSSADGGTVLLDEIGDMSPCAQAKLLRVIEKKEVCRIGSTKNVKLDLRFLAATNQDLAAMVGRGSFRKDLFFRLNVTRIHLPPLCERKEDILPLLDHYCREFGREGEGGETDTPKPAPQFSDDFLHALLHYDWPGNIRELRNLVESLSIGGMPAEIGAEDLPAHLNGLGDFRQEEHGYKCQLGSQPAQPERDSVISALFSAKGNKSEAAKHLGWSRMTLYRKIAKYNLKPNGNAELAKAAEA
jgi:DNA-binding NtrC family response regulator